ncbi:nuclear transport factor 2 family protein [Sphingomonas profundi]|uniref:nuclear transport factor 2 family protein n=1 Tax=Alterirhizorhabdus profundi TaxID=2681549 RepID=UPI0012E982BD|nr:nuclear transport factor 2 family protein [Sphingomonas profundi]
MAFTGPGEDRLLVRELIESYADAVTRRDAAAWAALWAEDARWSMPDLGTGVELAGKSTIVSAWIGMMAQYHGPADAPWAFSFVSILGGMAIDGDRATARSTSIEAFDDGTGRTVRLRGRYDDEMVREDGRWLFAVRTWRLMPLEDHGEMAA